MQGVRLIVGLGNPGKEYAQTRHNAGFWWVDAAADARHVALRLESKFHGEVGRLSRGTHEIWLLKPNTYMNASGRAVAALAKFYKLLPEQLLVVHDELDLPPGAVRLKKGGGHAGHNGLKDIASQLGSPDFWRLRLGIGHPGDRSRVVDYVLHAPRAEEADLVHDAITRSVRELPLIETGDFAGAMHRLHAREKAARREAGPEVPT